MTPGRCSSRPKDTGRRRQGSALIEATLMAPWFLFLFIGAFDFGFFSYSLIATQSAARMAALYASTSAAIAANPANACFYAQEELRELPNVTSCLTSGTVSSAHPLIVTTQSLTGADGTAAAQVTVSYLTIPLIPIPGFLAGRTTITRLVQMRVRG